MSTTARTLMTFYESLLEAYGPQRWWPGQTRTEIAVGAILTQNTNWQNVERAIDRLRQAGCLDWRSLHEIDESPLAELIRPAGYYNLKARRLKNLVRWLWSAYDGRFDDLADMPMEQVRSELLAINGIGPETADSIVLYALEMPSFVVDAYTARVVRRHGLVDGAIEYHELKALFEDNLPADVALFNEYHALIVAVGKAHCKPRARCDGCPLERFDHEVEGCD